MLREESSPLVPRAKWRVRVQSGRGFDSPTAQHEVASEGPRCDAVRRLESGAQESLAAKQCFAPSQGPSSSNSTITQAPNKNAPEGGGFVWWRVRDSNPRRLSRLIYSQIPLAARVTRRVHVSSRNRTQDCARQDYWHATRNRKSARPPLNVCQKVEARHAAEPQLTVIPVAALDESAPNHGQCDTGSKE